MKPEIKFGLLNAIIGLIVGVFHTFTISTNYKWLIVFAPISIFTVGVITWRVKTKNSKYNLGNIVAISFITGTLSHPLTFYLICIYYNLSNCFTGNCNDSLGELPKNLILAIPTSFFLSLFSLLFYGWFTVLTSIIIGASMNYNKKMDKYDN